MIFKNNHYSRKTRYGYRSRRRKGLTVRFGWLILLGILLTWTYSLGRTGEGIPGRSQIPLVKDTRVQGTIVSPGNPEVFSKEHLLALSKERYGAAAPQPKFEVTKREIKYKSLALDGTEIEVFARVYIPKEDAKLTTFMLATGTTGVGDSCAASLEKPKIADWQNYESHMATFAGQGYLSIVTDYEGMRDPNRIHHYMVGEQEGRVLLDGLRALTNLEDSKDKFDESKVYIGGFSQGGHAAGWADKIAQKYAPEVAPRGVIGFSPVSDVFKTWSDITQGANINWFGPYVLTSYADQYNTIFPIDQILQPKFAQNLRQDVLSKCIDKVQYWGPNSQAVYQPQFLEELKTGALSPEYSKLFNLMKENQVWDQPTRTPKLINQGGKDNVILPGQSQEAIAKICSNSTGQGSLKVYTEATHYNIIALSFNDTLSWIEALNSGRPIPNDCN